VSGSELERQVERSRQRLARLRERAEREGAGSDASFHEAVEELGQALEELTVTAEELGAANEELAEAQLAAEQHARRYLELFRSAPDAYVVTDERGVIQELNEMAEHKLGRSGRYLAGKPLLSLVAERDRDAFLACLSALQRRRGRLEDRRLRFGSDPGFDASVSAVPEASGEGLEIRWILRDVTERLRAEAALRASESRMRALAHSLRVLIAYVDSEECYRFNNAAYEEWCGISPEKLTGVPVREVLGEEAYGRLRPRIAGALAGKPQLFEETLPYTRGATRDVLVEYEPDVGEDGRVAGFYALHIDVSALKRAQQELRAAAAASAVAEDRERRRLATDLHDGVSQLLTLAGVKLGMLRAAAAERGLGTPLREVEEVVSEAHRRTESLTFQLSPPVLHDVGLVAATEWLADEMRRLYGLRVLVEGQGEPLLDEVARVTLFRALRELLINVARHARTPRASVQVSHGEGRVHIEVRDRGVGFDPELEPRGFGLFSIRERMRHLGGHFEIEAVPGDGTRVTLTAPLAAGARPPEPIA
jgi:PAS domain S-box-containing protein